MVTHFQDNVLLDPLYLLRSHSWHLALWDFGDRLCLHLRSLAKLQLKRILTLNDGLRLLHNYTSLGGLLVSGLIYRLVIIVELRHRRCAVVVYRFVAHNSVGIHYSAVVLHVISVRILNLIQAIG